MLKVQSVLCVMVDVSVLQFYKVSLHCSCLECTLRPTLSYLIATLCAVTKRSMVSDREGDEGRGMHWNPPPSPTRNFGTLSQLQLVSLQFIMLSAAVPKSVQHSTPPTRLRLPLARKFCHGCFNSYYTMQ